MPYTRRLTWPDEPDDGYVIRRDGRDVGRVYRSTVPEGERWLWFIFIHGSVRQVENVPIRGIAETLDEAAEKFKTSFERMTTARSAD